MRSGPAFDVSSAARNPRHEYALGASPNCRRPPRAAFVQRDLDGADAAAAVPGPARELRRPAALQTLAVRMTGDERVDQDLGDRRRLRHSPGSQSARRGTCPSGCGTRSSSRSRRTLSARRGSTSGASPNTSPSSPARPGAPARRSSGAGARRSSRTRSACARRAPDRRQALHEVRRAGQHLLSAPSSTTSSASAFTPARFSTSRSRTPPQIALPIAP